MTSVNHFSVYSNRMTSVNHFSMYWNMISKKHFSVKQYDQWNLSVLLNRMTSVIHFSVYWAWLQLISASPATAWLQRFILVCTQTAWLQWFISVCTRHDFSESFQRVLSMTPVNHFSVYSDKMTSVKAFQHLLQQHDSSDSFECIHHDFSESFQCLLEQNGFSDSFQCVVSMTSVNHSVSTQTAWLQ